MSDFIVVETLSGYDGRRRAIATNGCSWVVVKENDSKTSWKSVGQYADEGAAREELRKILNAEFSRLRDNT
jgi:hypothetical protein